MDDESTPGEIEFTSFAMTPEIDARTPAAFERSLVPSTRQGRMLNDAPWVRNLGKLAPEITVEGWKFPAPPTDNGSAEETARVVGRIVKTPEVAPEDRTSTRLKPPRDTVVFKDRLLYLLQPPLENLFAGKQVSVPFKPFPYQMEGLAFLMPRHAALLADEMGLGKAQPLDARVLTPTGWKQMGDVQVGDLVIGSQGRTTCVLGVYPQGEKEIFRVEFSDGSATECCDEHLWQIEDGNAFLPSPPEYRGRGVGGEGVFAFAESLPRCAERRPPHPNPLPRSTGGEGVGKGNPLPWSPEREVTRRVLSLREIRSEMLRNSGCSCIPLVEPVEFAERPLPLPPYLLGTLLAGGTPTDDGMIAILRDLGTSPLRPEAKFVPEIYRFASVASRLALLQGLLDTDGSVSSDNNVEYCTVSPQLAEDVRFLVQSLGGTACMRTKNRMSIALPAGLSPFALSRKANAYHDREKYPPRRAIVSVTPVGRKQAQCIAVDAPDHLYVTDDFIVTHNTMQTILSLRLLFHTGVIRRALLVCPKPLVNNWAHELVLWAEDIPFEILGGSTELRRASWMVSNCPLKVVNYELLTRDAEFVADEKVEFDVVVLDEAQRIKNKESRTALVVNSLKRRRSWALTGTPIENRPEDLVNIFTFIDPKLIPPDTPTRQLGDLTRDYILRRVKEEVMKDMPPKIIRDAHIELTPAQRDAYQMAEKEGVVRLNQMGDTITVQHVFELVMRLKQICNFDPLTGASAKLEQLVADMNEVAESGRKAIVFSQWVEPLEIIAQALQHLNPLQFHGKIPPKQRYAILDEFKADPTKHVILMSYATGSVGLNLQFTNYVFLFDRWWNPAVEDQAINRAHRLGQKEPVIVTRFVAQDTIEGRIAMVLEEKRQLFNELIANNGPPPSMGLTQEDIFGLFNIRARPRRAA